MKLIVFLALPILTANSVCAQGLYALAGASYSTPAPSEHYSYTGGTVKAGPGFQIGAGAELFYQRVRFSLDVTFQQSFFQYKDNKIGSLYDASANKQIKDGLLSGVRLRPLLGVAVPVSGAYSLQPAIGASYVLPVGGMWQHGYTSICADVRMQRGKVGAYVSFDFAVSAAREGDDLRSAGEMQFAQGPTVTYTRDKGRAIAPRQISIGVVYQPFARAKKS